MYFIVPFTPRKYMDNLSFEWQFLPMFSYPFAICAQNSMPQGKHLRFFPLIRLYAHTKITYQCLRYQFIFIAKLLDKGWTYGLHLYTLICFSTSLKQLLLYHSPKRIFAVKSWPSCWQIAFFSSCHLSWFFSRMQRSWTHSLCHVFDFSLFPHLIPRPKQCLLECCGV